MSQGKRFNGLTVVRVLVLAAGWGVVSGATTRPAEPAKDPDQGLIAHWRFEEGGGTTAKDSSPGKNDGILQGQCTFVEGKAGKALALDGSTAYMDVVGMKVDFEKNWTFAAWVKTTTDEGLSRTILTNFRDGSTGKGFSLFDERTNHRLNVYRYKPDPQQKTVNYESTVPNLFEKDGWVHLAVVADFEKDKLTVYKNGKDAGLKQNSTVAGVRWNNGKNALRLGAEDVKNLKAPYYFTGAIDEVRLYDRALTADEIAKLFEKESGSKK